jgi:O-antigen/teichoic acid export membrane protein
MTRTRKAVVASAFGYLQFASAIVLGLVVTPMVLRQVDPRAYGLWLAVGELLGYLALADVGVFAVLPWTIAEADGRRDREEIRRFMSNGAAIGAAVAALTSAAVAVIWRWAPGVIGLSPGDFAVLGGPLVIIVVATVISTPLAIFNAVLIGLQDVTFVGSAAVARSVAIAALTLGLLLAGTGLYALSIGAAAPMVAFAVIAAVRLARLEPGLARGWPRPSLTGMRCLIIAGVGGWLGGFGWRLTAMSSSLVLAVTGRADWIAIYACTSKTTQLLMQLCWIVPDSALIGLAQIHGEGRAERRQELVEALMRLYMILAGGAALTILAVNPAFVRWWVGPSLFGGAPLNALLAVGLIASSFAHALAVLSSALGRRTTMGAAGMAQGVLNVVSSVVFVMAFGFEGLPVAIIVSAAVIMIPVGLRTLAAVSGIAKGRVVSDLVEWSRRSAPTLAVALAIGTSRVPVWMAAAAVVPVGAAYLWMTRAFYAELPLHPRYRRLLATVRLAPAKS